MTKPFSLHPKQREGNAVLGAGQTHTLFYGGSRSGKTFLLTRAVAVRAIRASESRHLIARLHNIDVRQSVMLDTFPKVMRLAFPNVGYKANKQDQYVTLSNGSEIWFGGLDDKERVEKLLGKEFATIYSNESSQISYESQETLRTRLAQSVPIDDTGELLPLREYIDLNPNGRGHWTYKEFVENIHPVDKRLLDPTDYRYFVMNPRDNPHLPEAYIKQLGNLSARKRKRFLDGEYVSDVEGALWGSELLNNCRIAAPPELSRIVVAIDPQAGDDPTSDETGIIVAGVAGKQGYVLADRSIRDNPAEWARRAISAYHEFKADMIIAEANNGGAMVKHTIHSVDARVPVKLVYASRGKHTRAEPVSTLYSEKKIFHIGILPELEDQMTSWVPNSGAKSPDRMDALVWAISELMILASTPVITKVSI